MQLLDLVRPAHIELELTAADKGEAIATLAGRLSRTGAVTDIEAYTQAVLDREKQYSTAVGHGVAIPHGKSRAVARPAVGFGRLRRAIPWSDDAEEEPVRLVFLLAVPEEQAGDTHLRLLARLARLLLDEGFRSGLESAQTPAELLTALKRVEEDSSRGEVTA